MNPTEIAHKNLRDILLNGRILINGNPLTANELSSVIQGEQTLFEKASKSDTADALAAKKKAEKDNKKKWEGHIILGLVSVYTSDEHTIIKRGELSEWLKRLVEGDPRRKDCLFLLRYNELEVFCICEWVGGGNDTFVDVMNLGKSLGNFGRKDANDLRRRLFNPLTAEDTSKAIVDTDSDFYHNLQDEDAQEAERQELVSRGEWYE